MSKFFVFFIFFSVSISSYTFVRLDANPNNENVLMNSSLVAIPKTMHLSIKHLMVVIINYHQKYSLLK